MIFLVSFRCLRGWTFWGSGANIAKLYELFLELELIALQFLVFENLVGGSYLLKHDMTLWLHACGISCECLWVVSILCSTLDLLLRRFPVQLGKLDTPFVNPENCGYLSWQFQGIVALGCTSKSPWSMNIEESTIQSNAVAHSLVDLLLLCPYSKGYRTFPFELSLLRYQRVLWQHPLWQSTFQNLSSAGCHFCHCVVLFWARSWSPGHVRFYLISITNGRNNWWTDAVERVWATR